MPCRSAEIRCRAVSIYGCEKPEATALRCFVVDTTTDKERRSTLNRMSATNFRWNSSRHHRRRGSPAFDLIYREQNWASGTWCMVSSPGMTPTPNLLRELQLIKRTDASMIRLELHCSISQRSCSKTSLGIVIDDFAYGRNTTSLPTGVSTLRPEVPDLEGQGGRYPAE